MGFACQESCREVVGSGGGAATSAPALNPGTASMPSAGKPGSGESRWGEGGETVAGPGPTGVGSAGRMRPSTLGSSVGARGGFPA